MLGMRSQYGNHFLSPCTACVGCVLKCVLAVAQCGAINPRECQLSNELGTIKLSFV